MKEVGKMKVKVGVSARHVHLTKETFKKLYNKEELTVLKVLDQPTQFAASETVTIKNGENVFNNVRIVGPFRSYNQIEISKTDCFKLKLNPPVRMSGDLEGSSPITLIGPAGEVTLDKGCIQAMRHIHLNEKDLKEFNLKETDIVSVEVKGEKGGILSNVHLKVTPSAALRLHIDTDEANALGLKDDLEVEVKKCA